MNNLYRKRSATIEARQLDGDTIDILDVYVWAGKVGEAWVDPSDGLFMITTPEGAMHAYRGDWIIRGGAGELYLCKDDIFRQTYEPVEDGAA